MKKRPSLALGTSIALVAALCAAMPADAAKRRPVRARPAAAAPAPVAGNYSYQVQQGDTLRRIVDEYFVRDKAAYNAVWKLNHIVNPDHLTVGSTLTIPRRYLNVVPARAIVAAFRGDVSIGPNKPARINAVITEGARIETGANSSVSFTLEDGSTISLPSQSIFVLEKLRLVLISGEMQHIFRLDKGRSQFVVSPARGPAASFQVRTPVSVSAVRGTEFRVAVEDDGRASIAEVLKDNVEVTGRGGSELALNEGFGVKASEAGVGKPVKLLPVPQVVLPVLKNGDGSLTFNIKPVDGAARYRLQIASDLAFQDIREETLTDKTAIGIPTSPVGNYYVRVTAIDPDGIEGIQHIYPFVYNR